ncbi:efflux RND transporter periplasmic adaptor subunit [Tahibacter amnicola]|uniref:Efflux RND transporter periplasmic adaptor subunit n=1 Tax=Tahibacter amnicola TaxID=2976241 RepID=A0ABY6B848_9GAMM|nr:efflux RND transporter periplasmic adaptor subunit [Tahibacter amnicola]UXI66059.1 efflux RND transporter periplasmic adaptor subunit [Tahibacter amnicola]
MKRAEIIGVIAIIALSGALGWWIGAQRPTDMVPTVATGHQSAPAARRILYYRNPMGLPDTSQVPKKDSMGMDYVPVYADETSAAPGSIVIAPEKIQRLGVRTQKAELRMISHQVRASGTIAVDDTRHHVVAPRFDGWIERLYANRTGALVRRGAPLADVYSPELMSTQNEYVIAQRALQTLIDSDPQAQRGMQALADAALTRLKNWGISGAQLDRLRAGEVRRLMTLSAPIDGVVLDKPAIEGMRFMAGEKILDLADLSQVWLIADVPTIEASWVEPGQTVVFSSPALPGRSFSGLVEFIYPTIDAAARTVRARVVLDNRDGALRPNLYGDVVFTAKDSAPVLAVPASAMLDSGRRRIVLIALGGGRFEPREIEAGRSDETHVEITRGLADGESVVVSANFLIDAESNLRAALGGLTPHAKHSQSGPVQEPVDAAGAAAPTPHSGHRD